MSENFIDSQNDEYTQTEDVSTEQENIIVDSCDISDDVSEDIIENLADDETLGETEEIYSDNETEDLPDDTESPSIAETPEESSVVTDELQEETEDEDTEEETEEDEQEEETVDNKIVNKLNDKIAEFKSKSTKKKAKIISVFSSIFIVVMLIFTDIIPILPNAYNRFYVGNTYVIGETQGSVFDKCGENVLYAGNGVLMSFGPDMSCEFKTDAPTGQPMLETSGNNAIVYYSNSNQAIALIGNKVKNISTSNVITAATINSNGYYGVVTKEPGYESYIEVFNSSGAAIYKYHTNNHIIDISISDNGNALVASSYETAKGEVSGKVIFVDITSDDTGKEVVVKSNLISEVKFLNKDTVVAFGDMFTVAYTPGGIEKWRIKYDTKAVKGYDISSNGDIAFIFDRYSSELSESTIKIYGSNGSIKGAYESKNNVKYVSANNDYFLLSLDRQTVLLDDDADVVKTKNTKKDYRKAVLYSNYNFAFSIVNGVAESISVKH